MTHFDEELDIIRTHVLGMWELTVTQLSKAMEAFLTYNKELCTEVKKGDKKINKLDIKIDREIEIFIATHNPVAVDLRFLISMLQINSNLERIGDITKGIAKTIKNSSEEFQKELVDQTEVLLMMEEAYDMNKDLLEAFKVGDLTIAMSMFQRDRMLDETLQKSKEIIVDYIKKNPESADQGLDIREIILKLERIGDQCCNIAGEMVFYIEAQVIKHSKKKKLIDKAEKR